SYVINVVSVKQVAGGQVDFLLEVRNDQPLEGEIAQFQMSVDGDEPELVNIIANLPAGESVSFAFARSLASGPHAIRFSVGDSHTTVNVNVEAGDIAVSTPTPTQTAVPSPIPIATILATDLTTPTITPLPTNTTVTTNTPTPIPTRKTAVSPDLRHLEEKMFMLDLINTERAKAELAPVVLGDNIAAQLHAEAALKNCFASHWGIDGLKPYMRYSLAGGYQSNGENGSGSDYCIKASDGYRAIRSINSEISEAMVGWMGSQGHRRNILGKWHKKVNIGLAWDSYNFLAYQHFEGDYVEYDELPSIQDDILSLSGRTKNGARFDSDRDLGIQIYYDPPPHALTRGQVTRTYCYGSGLQIAALREPLTGGAYWTTDGYVTTHNPCPDPYDVPADARGPRSHDEAHRFWKAAYDLSQKLIEHPTTVPWITARKWSVREEAFSVTADLSDLIAQHGDGVYTILVWGKLGIEDEVISEYSIFHGTTPLDTYNQ
ncbi:MAG: CAP domain-containing protein, partial [Dehalococcoidia bacterium]|nr:CAP domain-containing protein [Dehalococcoidia bacterium]